MSYSILSGGEGNAKLLIYFIRKNAGYLLVGRWQDDFRMGIALYEFDFCKMDKMRIVSYLELVLEILMDNVHFCVSKRSQLVSDSIPGCTSLE